MTSKFVLVLMVLVAASGTADEYSSMKPLTGQFDIAGATAFDPDPSEPTDSHLRLYLTGDAAKTLYENMKVEPQIDSCGEALSAKIIGSTVCTRDNLQTYRCWLAIDIANQRVSGGWSC